MVAADAYTGKKDCVELLLSKGAKVDVQGNSGSVLGGRGGERSVERKQLLHSSHLICVTVLVDAVSNSLMLELLLFRSR